MTNTYAVVSMTPNNFNYCLFGNDEQVGILIDYCYKEIKRLRERRSKGHNVVVQSMHICDLLTGELVHMGDI